jgi:glutamate-1-semialdehyde 2,1-aminomutase
MLGKAIANGLPLGAIGGRRELMELVRAGKVHHCGTYNGNRACVAAANAVLSLIPTLDYSALMARGERLANGLCAIIAEAGLAAKWQGVGSMFGITIGDTLPTDYRSWWMETDRALWERIGDRIMELGVLSDSFIGLFFVSFAHTDDHVARTLNVCREAVREELQCSK